MASRTYNKDMEDMYTIPQNLAKHSFNSVFYFCNILPTEPVSINTMGSGNRSSILIVVSERAVGRYIYMH